MMTIKSDPATIAVHTIEDDVQVSLWDRDGDGEAIQEVAVRLDRAAAQALAMRLLRAIDDDRQSWYITREPVKEARKVCREHATVNCPCEGPIASND